MAYTTSKIASDTAVSALKIYGGTAFVAAAALVGVFANMSPDELEAATKKGSKSRATWKAHCEKHAGLGTTSAEKFVSAALKSASDHAFTSTLVKAKDYTGLVAMVRAHIVKVHGTISCWRNNTTVAELKAKAAQEKAEAEAKRAADLEAAAQQARAELTAAQDAARETVASETETETEPAEEGPNVAETITGAAPSEATEPAAPTRVDVLETERNEAMAAYADLVEVNKALMGKVADLSDKLAASEAENVRLLGLLEDAKRLAHDLTTAAQASEKAEREMRVKLDGLIRAEAAPAARKARKAA